MSNTTDTVQLQFKKIMGEGERRRFGMTVDEALREILGPLQEAGTISRDVHTNLFMSFNDLSRFGFLCTIMGSAA